MSQRRIFVISDLHLGGRPDPADHADRDKYGTRLNSSAIELTAFIDWIRLNAVESEATELVINGDLVDFLAEDDVPGLTDYALAWDVDTTRVCQKLDAIAARSRDGEGGHGVFEALRLFSSPSRKLVILLGNHDIELCLPAVRQRFRELLTSPTGHSPHFIYDGEAYTAGKVLIEHGNRYDPWNIVDFSGLREVRSQLSRGAVYRDNFKPPPGSRLVVEVINRLKAQYRWVDLLKPETEAVVPLLWLLAPSTRGFLGLAARFARETALTLPDRNPRHPAVPRLDGRLGAAVETDGPPGIAPTAEDVALDAILMRSGLTADEEATTRALDAPSNLVCSSKLWQAVYGKDDSALGDIRESLREAFRSHAFNPAVEDDNYLDAAKQLVAEGGFSVVIFGHTHLAKDISFRKDGRNGHYFNTGTWADMIRIPAALGTEGAPGLSAAREFLGQLLANNRAGIRYRCLSYVELVLELDDVVQADLRSYLGPGNERGPAARPYP